MIPRPPSWKPADLAARLRAKVRRRRIWKRVFAGRTEDAVELGPTIVGRSLFGAGSSASARTSRALILIPTLQSLAGHQLATTRRYAQLLDDLGYDTLVGHAELLTEGRGGSGWHPVFASGGQPARGVENVETLRCVEAYYAEVYSRILRSNPVRVVAFPAVRFTHVAAIATALEACGAARPERVVLAVLVNTDVGRPELGLARSTLGRAARTLAAEGIDFMACVETEAARDLLVDSGFSPERVSVFAYVSDVRDRAPIANPRTPDGLVSVGYLGTTRQPRNPDTVLDMILYATAPPGIRWKAQFDLRYVRRVRGRGAVRELQQRHEAHEIDLFPGALDPADFLDVFQSLDIMLLPYSPLYRHIGSGIIVEAILLEVIPVVHRDSTLYDLYTSLGGDPPSFEEATPAAVRAALDDGLDRLEELRAAAPAIRRRWEAHPMADRQWEATMTTWIGPAGSV